MNLKEIITSALEYLGEETADNYVGNTNTDISRLVVMLNASAADIVKKHEWNLLKKQNIINVVSGTVLYDLPDDYDRMISDTTYSNNWSVDLPTSDSIVAFNTQFGSDYRYQGRLIGGKVEFINVPPGELSFDYISNGTVKALDGTIQSKFLLDTDEWLLDDELIIRAMRQRYQIQTGEGDPTNGQDLANRLRDLQLADTGARTFNSNNPRNRNYWPYKR